MKRHDMVIAKPVDLGRASIETKGPPGHLIEFGVIAQPVGLTDD